MSLSNSSDQWAPSDTDVALASVKEQVCFIFAYCSFIGICLVAALCKKFETFLYMFELRSLCITSWLNLLIYFH